MDLEAVLEQVIARPATDSGRLSPLADYVRQRLADYGLPGARGGTGGELAVQGLARIKKWDVAYNFAGKDRLLISLKSIWRNASGTVPNRIDDLMGEAANVQQLAPEIVVGYVLLFDAQADTTRREDGLLWSQYFERMVKRIAIRKAPLWNQGLIEGTWFILFNSREPPGTRLADPVKVAAEEEQFFLALLRELQRREPAVPFDRPVP
jgi:hypothetical protein